MNQMMIRNSRSPRVQRGFFALTALCARVLKLFEQRRLSDEELARRPTVTNGWHGIGLNAEHKRETSQR